MIMQSLLNMFGIISLEQGPLPWRQLARIYENSYAAVFSGDQLLESLPLLLLLHLILLLLEL